MRITNFLFFILILQSCSVKENTNQTLSASPLQKNEISDECISVMPVKMNVLYIGVDNPFYVNVKGVSSKQVKVRVVPGSITGEDTQYTIRVTKPGLTTVYVYELNDKLLTARDFRVKQIPNPIAQVGGKSGGEVTVNEFKNQKGISLLLANFDFDARFSTTEYEMIYISKGITVKYSASSAAFTDEIKTVLTNIQPTDIVIFQNIKAKGPDGQVRAIAGISFSIIE